MELKHYIIQKKSLCNVFLYYIRNSSNDEANFQALKKLIYIQKVHESRTEIKEFIQLLEVISVNTRRERNFFDKIEQILLIFENQLKQMFSSIELYDLCKNCNRILLILFEHKILSVDDYNLHDMLHNKTYYYFYPELKSYFIGDQLEIFKNNLLQYNANIFDNFDANRKSGENESEICFLIRNDMIREFLIYYYKHNLSPKSIIPPSIFEANCFLPSFPNYPKNTNLLEYAAFFGSIKIFRFLLNENAEVNYSTWRHAVFSNNPKIIHLIEEKTVDITKFGELYLQLILTAAISSHNNNIVNYLIERIPDIDKTSPALSFYNFHYFPKEIQDMVQLDSFFGLKYYGITYNIYNSLKNRGELNEEKILFHLK